MKCLIVHETDKGFLGEEVEYKKSGSGSYRETTSITIPQTREEIVKFAEANAYSVEWRNLLRSPANA
ncbi:MAG: hypothetical protein SFX72_08400 [Isosphaeraceae bacterium]|nr:hypothetical protein [Isosphaeraceae bacterium]